MRTHRPFSISLVVLLTAMGGAPGGATPPPPAELVTRRLSEAWTARVARHTDRRLLAAAFAAQRYAPPKGAHLLITEIRQRKEPTTRRRLFDFAYYSLGDTAFAHSAGRYWPASSVKLPAAVGALLVLARQGLDGRARLRFKDSYGAFSGTAAQLYRPAIVRSSNRAYDRLVRIAGSDALSTELARFGLPQTRLSCPYAGAAEITRSPTISYRTQAGRRGEIAARQAKGSDDRCQLGANCTTLFEMSEILRRVVLHDHLAPGERFPLAARDIAALRAALRKARSKIVPAARAVFGRGLTIYNKSGRYPPWDQLDVALVVDREGIPRVLIAASVAYARPGEAHRRVERRLATLVRRGLEALKRRRPRPRWIRFDGPNVAPR